MECSICGGQTSHVGDVPGYKRSSVFRVYECSSCAVSSAEPLKSDVRIYDSIYANVSEVPGYSRYFHLANIVGKRRNPLRYLEDSEECYHGVIRTLVTDSTRGSVIEIGCGQGYLTYSMVRHGISATGLDISPEAVKLARARYGGHFFCGTLNDYLAQGGAMPSHVVCTELIEHLEDPVSFVRDVVGAMNTGGKLIVTTPHKISTHEGLWKTELPPVHLWWFSRESLVAIAKKAGVRASFFDFTEFYRAHDVREGEASKSFQRSSVLDENYGLVQKVPTRRLQPLIDQLKVFLPQALINAGRRISNKRGGGTRLTDSRARTLCVTFEKI